MEIALWIVAIAMIVVGIAGVVLPALPGILLVYGGIVLGAWIGHFEQIHTGTVIALGVLTVIGIAIDYAASTIAAQRAGASKLGLLGAAIGTIVGVFTGLIGIFFLPLVGAAIGEFIARRDALRAGKVGVATWVGLLVGIVAKLAIVFVMVGVFAFALIF
jgi:uncharacterized protein YqgC (DUF456 family)